jgi:hypothetical protein
MQRPNKRAVNDGMCTCTYYTINCVLKVSWGPRPDLYFYDREYGPNQELSLGTTVRSCSKRTRTRASSCLSCVAYVTFLCGSSLIDVRKWFDSRYRASWAWYR